jgi:hypothetical protein
MLVELPTHHTEMVPVYFSARLSQASALPQDVSSDFQIFDVFQEGLIHIGSAIPLRALHRSGQVIPAAFTTLGFPGSRYGHRPMGQQPPTHTPQWLDFTQLIVNPYFAGFFIDEDRFATTHGRYDYTLRSGPGIDRIFDRQLFPLDLTELLGSIFFPQPPRVRVMICAWTKRRGGNMAEAVRIDVLPTEERITIADMLRALEEWDEATIHLWRDTVGSQLDALRDMHWKHDIWYTYGKSKLSVMLCEEDVQDDIEQGLYCEQMSDMRPRVERQGEWMPVEMMKPPKPTSPETDDILPGIYGVGLR